MNFIVSTLRIRMDDIDPMESAKIGQSVTVLYGPDRDPYFGTVVGVDTKPDVPVQTIPAQKESK